MTTIEYQKQKKTSGEKSLTAGEVEKLLSVVDRLSHEVLLRIEIECGLRRSDLVRIEIGNIDFDNGFLYYKEKKKGDRIHKVALGESLMVLLKKYLRTLPKSEKWLLPSPLKGKGHLSDRQTWNIFNNYLKISELESRGVHSLRATCVKLRLRSGWSESEVARHINDSIRVVHEHYNTPSDDEMREVVRNKPLF